MGILGRPRHGRPLAVLRVLQSFIEKGPATERQLRDELRLGRASVYNALASLEEVRMLKVVGYTHRSGKQNGPRARIYDFRARHSERLS